MYKMKNKKEAMLTVRLTESCKSTLQKEAEKECRSLSNYVQKLLSNDN